MVILQGKFNASLKETTFTGSSFSNHLRAEKISTLLTIKVKSITLYDVKFSKKDIENVLRFILCFVAGTEKTETAIFHRYSCTDSYSHAAGKRSIAGAKED